MNSSRLREIVDLLLDREGKFQIQTVLNEVNAALSNLTNNPQNAEIQTQYAKALEKLEVTMRDLSGTLAPAEMKEIAEIGAEPYFSTQLVTQIRDWVQQNPISPAVAQKQVSDLFSNRNSYIQTITQLRDNFTRLKIEPHKVAEGSTEVGFLIPRDLFKNELEQLIKELGVINRILRAISELATGTAPPIQVREISTTDPLFFFGLDPVTIATLGIIVRWALNQWKIVEEIRKLRSETKKNESFSDADIKGFFDLKIEKTIEGAVSAKVAELLKDDGKAGRSKEQITDLTWALKSILARIERGMTVEIRFLPPPAQPAVEGQAPVPTSKAFSDLAEVVPQLSFPPRETSPVLELPPPEPPKEAGAAGPAEATKAPRQAPKG